MNFYSAFKKNEIIKFTGRKWMNQENAVFRKPHIASSFSYSDLSFSISYVHFFLGVRKREEARKQRQGPWERTELLSVDNYVIFNLNKCYLCFI